MDNKQLIVRWFEEVWNQGRPEAIEELMTPDCRIQGLGDAGRDLAGAAGFREFYTRFRGAFPDIRITVEETVAEGDMVAARFSVTATHQGDGFGMPATGRPVAVTGMCFTRCRDGRVVEAWNEFDAFSLVQQLGSGPDMQVRA